MCSCEIYEKRMILCYSEKYRYIVKVKNGISGQIAILNIYKELFPYFGTVKNVLFWNSMTNHDCIKGNLWKVVWYPYIYI